MIKSFSRNMWRCVCGGAGGGGAPAALTLTPRCSDAVLRDGGAPPLSGDRAPPEERRRDGGAGLSPEPAEGPDGGQDPGPDPGSDPLPDRLLLNVFVQSHEDERRRRSELELRCQRLTLELAHTKQHIQEGDYRRDNYPSIKRWVGVFDVLRRRRQPRPCGLRSIISQTCCCVCSERDNFEAEVKDLTRRSETLEVTHAAVSKERDTLSKEVLHAPVPPEDPPLALDLLSPTCPPGGDVATVSEPPAEGQGVSPQAEHGAEGPPSSGGGPCAAAAGLTS